MTKQKIAPYGSWKSPITSDLIVAEAVGLSQPALDGDDIYWNEMRPSEGGRNVIVRRDASGSTRDVIAAPFNARTRVHEYGGGRYVARQGAVYFSNFVDQRIYLQSGNAEPQAITPVAEMRFADAIIDGQRARLICVREDHSEPGREAVNSLVGVRLDGSGQDCGQLLVSGNDFYAAPRLSPDGRRLAWLTWNHPNMPWDGCELWIGQWQLDGTLGETRRVAGSLNESIFQPTWSPNGVLYFVSDRNGWWNLYRLNDQGAVEPVCEMEAELGMPQGVFGMSSYAFAWDERIGCN